MPDHQPSLPGPHKPFGLWSATFLVVASMIGAGVFTTSGFSLGDLGDRHYVLYAWLIGSLIAICGAVSYGQLAQRVTESGGEYLFLSRMVHPAIGFLAGWVSLLAGFTGAIAFAATAFETYAFPESLRPEWFQPGMLGIAVILLFGLLHSLVLQTGLIAQNFVVVLKLALLAIFVGIAFANHPSGWQGVPIQTEAVPFSIYAIASTLVWISLSFSGFNAAVYITEEVTDPKRNVPLALLLGTVAVSVFYLVVNYIFLFGAAPEKIAGAKDVAAVASQAIGGNALATFVRIIVSISLLSSVSSMIVAGPRVYAKMAEEGLFPQLLNASQAHDRAVPVTAIWLQVVLAAIVVHFSSLQSLLFYLGFTLSVSAAVTVTCIFWNRRPQESPVRRVFFSAIALVYVTATLGIAVLSAIGQPQHLIGFAVTILSGLLIYYCMQRLKTGRDVNKSN